MNARLLRAKKAGRLTEELGRIEREAAEYLRAIQKPRRKTRTRAK